MRRLGAAGRKRLGASRFAHSATSAGTLINKGVSPFGLAAIAGAVMLIPAVAWLFALRLWLE